MKFLRLIGALLSVFVLLGLFACQKPAETSVPETAASSVPSVKKSSPEEIQALIQACREGDLEKVKELIAAGVDVNGAYWPSCDVCRRGLRGCTCPSSETPLLVASWTGNVRIVKELIKAGADVNKSNSSNETPLMFASSQGHYKVVKILLSAGANVKVRSKSFSSSFGHRSYTALDFARAHGHEKIVKMLLRAKSKE